MITETNSVPSALSCSKSDSELARVKRLITEAQAELQYAHASNCPLHWVKIAQQKLTEALA